MAHYNNLSRELQERIMRDRQEHWINPYACRDEEVIRRDPAHDRANLWRPAYVRDSEKIMHIPYYNRYADKTQVFSLYRNDDISRRSQHVQLVSRIARNIGKVLNLNLDLIEAAALGHDIGHTPFGHAGERKLNELYYGRTGRYFNHNIQSARVLDRIFPLNLSLQTLDGIICHNGEMPMEQYTPKPYAEFSVFDGKMENCYVDRDAIKRLVPATLEGCVVRVSDIIAYLGKDRQDAIKLRMLEDDTVFAADRIGRSNAEIINNMIVNIIENSYGKPYLQMEPEFYEAFVRGKRENANLIYQNDKLDRVFDEQIYPMLETIYDKLLADVRANNRESVIYRHHIEYIKELTKYYARGIQYEENEPDDIVVDYIASMTDDYLIDLYGYLFPKGKCRVGYIGYFG